MLQSHWKQAALEFKIASSVIARSLRMFRITRDSHRGDVQFKHGYIQGEVNAALSAASDLHNCNSNYFANEPVPKQIESAREITGAMVRLNERIQAVLSLDEHAGLSVQMEASPVLAKANDILLYMKRNNLTPFATAFAEGNDATGDRQSLIPKHVTLPTDKCDAWDVTSGYTGNPKDLRHRSAEFDRDGPT